jgi:hypothetical protein
LKFVVSTRMSGLSMYSEGQSDDNEKSTSQGLPRLQWSISWASHAGVSGSLEAWKSCHTADHCAIFVRDASGSLRCSQYRIHRITVTGTLVLAPLTTRVNTGGKRGRQEACDRTAHNAVNCCLSNAQTQFGPVFEFESTLPSLAPIFRVCRTLFTGCAPPHNMLSLST